MQASNIHESAPPVIAAISDFSVRHFRGHTYEAGWIRNVKPYCSNIALAIIERRPVQRCERAGPEPIGLAEHLPGVVAGGVCARRWFFTARWGSRRPSGLRSVLALTR